MKQQGFTLIELLISFSLLTFLISATAQLTIQSLLVKRRADCTLKSAELASSKLEYFKSLPYESDELKEGLRTESLTEDGTQKTFRIEWRIKDTSLDTKRIEIESSCENLPLKKTRLVLFLSRELGF